MTADLERHAARMRIRASLIRHGVPRSFFRSRYARRRGAQPKPPANPPPIPPPPPPPTDPAELRGYRDGRANRHYLPWLSRYLNTSDDWLKWLQGWRRGHKESNQCP